MTTPGHSSLRRASLFVRDMERALAFYCRVFGLEVYHDREIDLATVPGFPVPAQCRQGRLRLVILRGSDPLIGMIGLMAVRDPPLPEPAGAPALLGQGRVALVLSTADAAAAAARVQAGGGTLLTPVSDGRNIGDAAGNLIPARLFMATDPDGHFLEVFEPL